MPLVVRSGEAASQLTAIAAEVDATTCHVIIDDVEASARASQRAAVAALAAKDVSIQRWDGSLRSAPWDLGDVATLPSTYPEYTEAAAEKMAVPLAPVGVPMEIVTEGMEPIASDGVPPLSSLLEKAAAVTPPSVLAARAACPTDEPYEAMVTAWCAEGAARTALESYCRDGRDAFAERHMTTAMPAAATGGGDGSSSSSSSSGGGGASLYAAAHQWLLDGGAPASAVLAYREAASRAFSPSLSLGVLSAREVAAAAVDAAEAAGETLRLGGAPPYLGRSSAASLADVVEEREWYQLLARRTLALQEKGLPAGAPSDPRGGASGDARAPGTFEYWRWRGQHLTRYEKWEAGEEWVEGVDTPPLLLVHGFAASCEQWERLVYELRQQADADGGIGASKLPPIYSIDMLGFGHAEKPGITYTQHLWEAQVSDFAIEIMGGKPLILGGNSIGGGIAAGVAGNLRCICRGVLLCNTAGVLCDPEEYVDPPQTVGALTRSRRLPKAYSPLPLLGQRGLDLFGIAVVQAIYPSIRGGRLADIYASRPRNCDDAVIFAIEQGASNPGSPNVIGSGQKLPPQRPLNEVLGPTNGFGGPVLVAQGLDDRVSGPQRAVQRAKDFKRFRSGVSVQEIADGGHCCQDEVPDKVAAVLLKWLPEVMAS